MVEDKEGSAEYKMTPEEEALVLEGLADYKAGRMYSEQEVREAIREAVRGKTAEQVKEELAQYYLTAEEENQVVEAEEQVKLGLVHTTEEVLQGLKENRAEWIKKNPRSA